MKAKIPLSQGLLFSHRNAELSRFLDVSYTAKRDVLSTRRAHRVRFPLNHPARKIMWSEQQQGVFILSTGGVLTKNQTDIEGGYSSEAGSLLEIPPKAGVSLRYVFTAADKMTKYDGTSVTKWGITAPAAQAVSAVAGGATIKLLLNNCDHATDWTPDVCTVADESTIKQQGDGSIKVSIPAGGWGSISTTFPSVLDFRTSRVLSFWVRISDPSSIRGFSVDFDLDNSNFVNSNAHRDYGMEYQPQFPAPVPETIAATIPQESSGETQSELTDRSLTRVSLLPGAFDQWKQVLVGLGTFSLPGTLDWRRVYRMRFSMFSVVNQDVYLDYIYTTEANQNDAIGARYKYAFENSRTGHHSNLNQIPSDPVVGQNGVVIVTGFQQPSDPQVDTIRVFRDVGSDGNYSSVGTVAVPSPWTASLTLQDGIPIEELGELDLNDNSPPPPASLAAYYKGSVWVNDLNNKRRLWRSIPGRYESYSLSENAGFFDISIVGDEIVDFALVRGNFYLVTKQAIISVLAADVLPTFVEVANLGVLSERAVFSFRDSLTFVHTTGVYTFDSANLRLLPEIESLFNPLSTDSRRVTDDMINRITIGSDAKHIWLSTPSNMYTHSLESRQWVEETNILVAHDDVQVLYHHLAADMVNLYDTYGDETNFETFNVRSDLVELPTISHINAIEIEYFANVSLYMTTYVDGVQINTTELPANGRRLWFFHNLEDILGQHIEIELVAKAPGLVELYDCQANVTVLRDTTRFDSEFFALPDERTVVYELHSRVFGLADGAVEATVFIDGQVSRSIDLPLQRNRMADLRSKFHPLVGSVGRLRVEGARFAPIKFDLTAVVLGNGERYHVEISTGTA